jgi:hypothetical protein
MGSVEEALERVTTTVKRYNLDEEFETVREKFSVTSIGTNIDYATLYYKGAQVKSSRFFARFDLTEGNFWFVNEDSKFADAWSLKDLEKRNGFKPRPSQWNEQAYKEWAFWEQIEDQLARKQAFLDRHHVKESAVKLFALCWKVDKGNINLNPFLPYLGKGLSSDRIILFHKNQVPMHLIEEYRDLPDDWVTEMVRPIGVLK